MAIFYNSSLSIQMNTSKFIKNKSTSLESIPVINHINKEIFYTKFVGPGTPVVIKGKVSTWKALCWNKDYFKAKENGVKVPIKLGDVSKGEREKILLSTYMEKLDEYEAKLVSGSNSEAPGYLHDIPFFYMFPKYVPDISPFPKELLPAWYQSSWENYIQFFMGSTGSFTPLHFDTLLTHNIFFQVTGKKRFYLIDCKYKSHCYIEGWRWARFDPSKPDYKKFPKAEGINIKETVLEPGDILYIPPGFLHQVHGLTQTISFNIDWHTVKSSWKGINTFWQGAPPKNIYYNSLLCLGLTLGIPEQYIFPFYKSYLNYVS